jgi:hypothetical protein
MDTWGYIMDVWGLLEEEKMERQGLGVGNSRSRSGQAGMQWWVVIKRVFRKSKIRSTHLYSALEESFLLSEQHF